MVVYDSAKRYIESCADARAKIIAIDKIIDALLSTAMEAALTGNITEYDLDTGQTKVKCLYRSPQEVMNAITTMEAIKQHYVNNINGRSMHLVDGKNFRQYPYGTGLV